MFKDNFSKLLYITKYEFFFITPYCPTFLMGATLLPIAICSNRASYLMDMSSLYIYLYMSYVN